MVLQVLLVGHEQLGPVEPEEALALGFAEWLQTAQLLRV